MARRGRALTLLAVALLARAAAPRPAAAQIWGSKKATPAPAAADASAALKAKAAAAAGAAHTAGAADAGHAATLPASDIDAHNIYWRAHTQHTHTPLPRGTTLPRFDSFRALQKRPPDARHARARARPARDTAGTTR
jgi:hypothetical protein